MTKTIKEQRQENIQDELERQERNNEVDQYVEDNKGYITASKLKCFLNNPQEYQLKFQKWVIRWKWKTYFKMGNAFDYLLSYGSDAFFDKYREKKVKRELKDMLDDDEYNTTTKKDELLEKTGLTDKIVLTKWQMKKIRAMYEEVSRQPLMKPWDESFAKQKTIEAEYKWLPIKGTLDRFSLEQKEIRDRKTTSNLEKFIFKAQDFGYDISMAFYYVLAQVEHGIKCDSYLDVIERDKNATSRVFKMDKSNLARTVENKIKPGLEKLMEYQEKYGEEEIRPAKYPLTDSKIPREEIEKSDYYDILPCAIQKEPEHFG